MKGKRVLVTGGTGFIGGFTLEALLDRGAEVVSLSRKPPDIKKDHVTYMEIDVTDTEGFKDLVQDREIDTIVHLAGYGTTMVQSNPELGIRVNIMAMSNVLEAARKAGLKVVFTSSIGVYGRIEPKDQDGVKEDAAVNPITVYGAGKLLCEKMGQAFAENYGVKFIALRVLAVYGFSDFARRGIEHPTFSDHAKRLIELPFAGQPVVVERGGKQPCDFVYVKDVAQAIVGACEADDLHHSIFNIGSGKLKTLKDFVDVIKKLKPGADVQVGQEPNPFYPFMGPVDISRAVDELNYKPTPFPECIRDYVQQIESIRSLNKK